MVAELQQRQVADTPTDLLKVLHALPDQPTQREALKMIISTEHLVAQGHS